jgi:hypothetical protein
VPFTDVKDIYYVLEGETNDLDDLQVSANIELTSPRFGLIHMFRNGIGFSPEKLTSFFFRSDDRMQPARRIEEGRLLRFRGLFKKWKLVAIGSTESPEHPWLQRAATMFENLNDLPEQSDSHVLGLFAIIEMMIAHNPNGKEIGDSITHQMKKKISLLTRRFDVPLDYSKFLPSPAALTSKANDLTKN